MASLRLAGALSHAIALLYTPRNLRMVGALRVAQLRLVETPENGMSTISAVRPRLLNPAASAWKLNGGGGNAPSAAPRPRAAETARGAPPKNQSTTPGPAAPPRRPRPKKNPGVAL